MCARRGGWFHVGAPKSPFKGRTTDLETSCIEVEKELSSAWNADELRTIHNSGCAQNESSLPSFPSDCCLTLTHLRDQREGTYTACPGYSRHVALTCV